MMGNQDVIGEHEELMCLGGPLHGSLRPRGQMLSFQHTMAKNPLAPNPKFIDEQHTYVLSTFDYSPELGVRFWRHKDLDLGRAPQFTMLDFLVNRPSLKLAHAHAALISLHKAFLSPTAVVTRADVLALIEGVIKPQQQPKQGDPQP